MYRYKTWFLSSLNSDTITSKSTDLKVSVILSPSWKKCVHWQKCVCLTAKSTSCSYQYNKGKETQQTTLFYMQHQKEGDATSICNWNRNEKAAKCDHKHATDLHKHHPMEFNSAERFSNGLVNIILPEERYFYALSCTWDKEENQNPHEKLNFRPSANSSLH